jgi:acyl-coenzyme A thioesterase PaaI-like protein
MMTGGGGPGLANPELLSGKTGLEVLQAMLRSELPFPPIAETLDFSLISVEAGKAVFQGTPQFKHYNPLGSVHGGWFATLLDSALGCAVQSVLPHPRHAKRRIRTAVSTSIIEVRQASAWEGYAD